jgi:transposase
MRTKGSAQELEKRRFHAIRLLEQGYGPTEVSTILGADRRTVQRWQERFRERGEGGIRSKPHLGPHPKLDTQQLERLGQMLLKGPLAHGFSTDLWTGGRVCQLVHKHFGISYHPCHIPRVLRAMGWSPQRPERKAYERNASSVDRWTRQRWTFLKKSPEGKGPSRLPG